MCFLIVVCYGAVCCMIWFSFCVLWWILMYIVVQLCVTVQFVVWSESVFVCCGEFWCIFWCSCVLRCSLLYHLIQFLCVVNFDVYCGVVVCYGSVCCMIWFSFCVLRCSLSYDLNQFLCVVVNFDVYCGAVCCMIWSVFVCCGEVLCYGAVCCVVWCSSVAVCCLLFVSWIMYVLSKVGDANLWLIQTNVTLYKNPGGRLFTRGQPPLEKEAGLVMRSLGKGRCSRILHRTAFWSVLLSDCSIFKFLVCMSQPLCLFSWT